MHLLAIGLNYRTAPLEIREQLTFTSSELCAFLEDLPRQGGPAQNGSRDGALYESCVLSTCNRLEYYTLVQSPPAATEKIINLFSQACHLPSSTFRPYLYTYQDKAAVQHLMLVAASLDSMVLGEAQILGQVVTAYQTALAHNTIGSTLSRLFEMAIHAGKRVRKETDIGLNPASISSVALRLAQERIGNLAGRTGLVLGAGNMGHLTMQNLVSHGVTNLLIANRTQERARQLAEQWDATPLTFDQLETGLRQADLVIASTSAPHTVLHQHQVSRAMQSRPDRPLVVIDIAMPRDVDAEVGELPGVYLYNIDHLQTQVAHNLQARRKEVPEAETIIAEEMANFMNWRRSLSAVPTITDLRDQFEGTRQLELERALNRLSDLDEKDREVIIDLSRRLMNKFLHHPTVRLREETAQGNGELYTSVARDLFALEEESPL